jgi:hypothetical protein
MKRHSLAIVVGWSGNGLITICHFRSKVSLKRAQRRLTLYETWVSTEAPNQDCMPVTDEIPAGFFWLGPHFAQPAHD